jgi:hypothetical protein
MEIVPWQIRESWRPHTRDADYPDSHVLGKVKLTYCPSTSCWRVYRAGNTYYCQDLEQLEIALLWCLNPKV